MLAGVSIITAILGFAFVIFIHELGHFLFAKWAGVKVERFSIGMGWVIWSRTIGETEYALSILPIGGYVKMLGQEDLPGQHLESSDARSFSNKHPGWRAAILFGGVLFNIVSSYIIMLILAWYGLPVIKPQIGTVEQFVMNERGEEVTTPAWSHNLRTGDTVLTINGEKIRSFTDIFMYSMLSSTEPVAIQLQRQDGTVYEERLTPVYSAARGSHTLGINVPQGLRIGSVVSLADSGSGIQEHDRIVGIVGVDENYDEMQLVGQQANIRLSEYVGQDIEIRIDRQGETQTVPLRYIGNSYYDLINPSFSSLVYVLEVMDGLPADEAGVQGGDFIYRVNGVEVINATHLQGLVRKAALAQEDIDLEVYRLDDQGAYQVQRMSMRAAVDDHTGKSIIGVYMGGNDIGVAGPVLSHRPVPGSQNVPLQEAGIAAGAVILRTDMPSIESLADVRQTTALSVEVASRGQIHTVPLSKAQWRSLIKIKAPGFWQKLFRIKARPSAWEMLRGSRVHKAATEEDPVLLLSRLPNKEFSEAERFEVDLYSFDKEQRQAFYQIKKDDRIVAMRAATADSDFALMLLRGAADEDISWQDVKLADAGSALQLMVEERPYQLESWTEGFDVANDMCSQIIVTTLNIIPRFFKSADEGGIEASKSLSGPIGIFAGMKQKTEYFGFASFLKLLAFIGINLFMVNLLPIPIVDGGQLVFLGIEVIIRRPVPMVVVEVANYMGLLLIVALMIFILGIDIERHLL